MWHAGGCAGLAVADTQQGSLTLGNRNSFWPSFRARLGSAPKQDLDKNEPGEEMISAYEGKGNEPLLRSANAVKDSERATWLIDELLEMGKLGVIYGPAKSGRSFVALDLAVAAANGEIWFGRKVKQVPVSYVWNGEPSSCSRRLEALSKRGRRLPDTLRVFGGPVSTGFGGSRSSFSNREARQEPFIQAIHDENACNGLIVIDSVMTTWTMFNEVEWVLSECETLRNETGCAVVLVDQFGTLSSTNKKPRELADMLREVDFAVEIIPPGFAGCEWKLTSAREAANGERRSFDLVPIQISENNFGHCGTACVVEDRGVIRSIEEMLSDAEPKD